MQARFGEVTVELVRGDIVRQEDCDAVVNAANAELLPGGGVAGAIHRAAGPALADAGRPLAPIEPGEAVITDGFELLNDYVIHCLGPIYGEDEPSDELLAACYRNALDLAEERRLGCVAFPAISTGAFGYPMEPAARIALATVKEKAAELEAVKKVRFVLRSSDALAIHEAALQELGGA